MKPKLSGLAVAAFVAAGIVSSSASASALFGNNSQKGSLLIWPLIQVGPFIVDGGGESAPTTAAAPFAPATTDTIITLTNDSTLPVTIKCFYASSDDLGTPYTGTALGARGKKHYEDFTLGLTHNQTVAWWASNGNAFYNSENLAGFAAPPFGYFPDGQYRAIGELKCWAVTDDAKTQKSHNHLYGTASLISLAGAQAYEYTAWAFQSHGAAEAASATPGVINLDNTDYDACPNMLLGNFLAAGLDGAQSVVALASCNQDLRQNFTPTITKLTWTFWNQDEAQRTGVHWCADSWFEWVFPTTGAGYTTYFGLGTEPGYFRIETTADKSICGPDATTSAYVGVIVQSFGPGYTRGTNLTGRGSSSGTIRFDPVPF